MRTVNALYTHSGIKKEKDILLAIEIDIPCRHSKIIDYGVYTDEYEKNFTKAVIDKFKDTGNSIADLYPTIIPKELYDFVNELKGEFSLETLKSLFEIIYSQENILIGNKKKLTADVIRELFYILDGLHVGGFQIFYYIYRKIDVNTIEDNGGNNDEIYWFYYNNFKK